MKAMLEFNLPEERPEFRTASQAGDLHCVLWDLDQWLRGEIKYNDRGELQPVRDRLHELLDQYNVNLYAD